MADITMCKTKSCRLKGNCYRFQATPNEWRQSYFTQKDPDTPEKPCDNYIDQFDTYRSNHDSNPS